MLSTRLQRVAGGTAAATLAFTMAAASAAGVNRTVPASRVAHPTKAATLITIPSEGGTLAAFVYRGWMDYWGVAIPGDSQGAPGGNPLDSAAQLLYAAIGTGGTQSDTANQQSGWSDTTVGSGEPGVNGSPVYGGQADSFLTTCPSGVHDITQCGYQPAAGKALETRGGTTSAGNSTTPDSMTFGAGDAPWPLTELAVYNNSNGQASGYNLQRGPLVQVPLLATAAAIPYNATGLTVPAGQSGIQLSRNSLCGIFEGHITNWNDPSITADNGGNTIGNQAITIVHRSDGSGTTFLFSYDMYVICAQSNVQSGNVWTLGVGTGSENGPISGPPPNNTVVWPAGSVGEKGSGALASYVASTPGAIGYVSPSYIAKDALAEAYVQNAAGNFETASVANTKAAIAGGPFVKSTQTSQIPPGFPYLKNTYIPLPSASTAAPLVGYTFGYFYQCSAYRELNQIGKLHAFIKWAMTPQGTGGLTPADTIAEANGLVELPDKAPKTGGSSKQITNSEIAPIAVYSGSHSGNYVDPTTGNTLPYTCTPLQ
jgi:ABC-type phosphate transport system substrate-binding protein